MALALLTSPLVSVANITLGALDGVQRVACAEFYGQQKSSTDCVAAIRQMPSGETPVTYTFGGYDRATRLPQYYQSAFPTVSLSTVQPDYLSPGNYDPAMAQMLAAFVFETVKRYSPLSELASLLRQRAIRLLRREEEMIPRGQRIDWWGRPGERWSRLARPAEEVNATVVPEGGGSGGAGTQTARRMKRRRRVVNGGDK
ncbi:MAG: hypothetical protein Q9202_006272 [Teloschistes flavicans]